MHSPPRILSHMSLIMPCKIRSATAADVPLILSFICDLAAFEKLLPEVVATEETLRRTLFSNPPAAHVVIAEVDSRPAGFALYFFNYSTFLAQPGLYLEDLFVKPEFRGHGTGKALLLHLAKIANARSCVSNGRGDTNYCMHHSGSAIGWLNVTSINSDFHLAEGCAAYLAVITSAANVTVTPDVSVTYNPASAATGACA